MKLIVFLLVILSLVSSCTSIDVDKAQKKHFLKLLDEGYRWDKGEFYPGGRIFIRNKNAIKTCVYHMFPNQKAKKTIESLYNFLHQEFKVFSLPQYKKTLEMCSRDTELYINLMSYSEMDGDSLTVAASNIFAIHNISFDKRLKPSLGQVIIRYRKRSGGITFISIMQVIDEKKYETSYLAPTILEELFQAISIGRDINVRKKPMSKLHEDRLRFKTGLPYEFEKFERYNPVALCGFDIWYLILVYGDEEKLSSYDAYSSKFLKSYNSIKNRALEITKNPAYKDLFDPRCSGKNTGINTKIGIE